MARSYINKNGKVTFRETSCPKRKGIEISFFDTEEELDRADQIAFRKYKKNGYDDLTATQKANVRKIIKGER